MFFGKLVRLVLVVSTLGSVAQAGEWRDIGPIQSGDVNAFVSYQVTTTVPAGDIWNGGAPMGPESYKEDASPLWVNVRRPNLSVGDHVFVQIISYLRQCYRGDCFNTQSISQRDLEYAENGRFTGQMQSVELTFQLNDGYALSNRKVYATELVIWINGVLYKDAAGHNLRFDMAR